MKDLDFMKDYQEVLHDNLSTIIKQNILFQTQLKRVENDKQTIQELNNQLQTLKNSVPQGLDVKALHENYVNLQNDFNILKEEKNKLQSDYKKVFQQKEFLEKENISIKEKNKENGKVLSEKSQIENSFKKTIGDLLSDKEVLSSKILELQENISVYKSMIAPSKLRGLFKKIEKEKVKVDSGN